MAEEHLSRSLEALRDLLLEEARFLSGFSNQVEEIRVQLELMKSFLRDADQKQLREENVRKWVQEVRDLAYKTEDVLETYGVEVAYKRGKGIKGTLKRFAYILSEGFALHKLGKEISIIKSEIAKLQESREAYGIRNLHEGESSTEVKRKEQLLRQTNVQEVEEHFVGRNDDIQHLVSLLTDDEKEHRVISIWGMGGLGKTTLARKIFNRGDLRHSFEASAWVCITQQFEIKEVCQDILKQILEKDIQGEEAELVRELYKVLKEKKCLIVIDDIWKVNDWEILRPAFPTIEGSSKFLITTRKKKVAEKGFLYELNDLKEEAAWDLLQKKALVMLEEKDHKSKQTFKRLGKEIVRKCGYHPLSISVLGGVLRGKSSIEEWKQVNENVDFYLRRGGGDKEQLVMDVLDLSYNELPYYLKPCFLYMGFFIGNEIHPKFLRENAIDLSIKKKNEIDSEKLCQQWISEGLVLSEHRRKEETMMDVAVCYLDELASRGMVVVEVDDISIVRRLKSCRLHDLMRELCLAKGSKERFFQAIATKSAMFRHASHFPDNYLRRLDMRITRGDAAVSPHPHLGLKNPSPFEKIRGEYLRTFSMLCTDFLFLEEWMKFSGFKKFKLLRILDMDRCLFKGRELPREISHLINLRYLGLHNTNLRALPSSLVNLQNLQTLDMREERDAISFPNIIGKMKRLKHIYLPSQIYGYLQFNELSELETLHGLRCSDVTVGLSQLINLRSFYGVITHRTPPEIIDEFNSWRKIKWMEVVMLGDDLRSKKVPILLRKVLSCEKLTELKINGAIRKFPQYEPQFCPNLTRLILNGTRIEEDPMQCLEKLPNLRVLGLLENAFVGKEMHVCDEMAFPELRYLQLRGLENLEEWRVDEGAMPNLSVLSVNACQKLETMTSGSNLSAHNGIIIKGVSKSFWHKYKILYDDEGKKFYISQHQNN